MVVDFRKGIIGTEFSLEGNSRDVSLAYGALVEVLREEFELESLYSLRGNQPGHLHNGEIARYDSAGNGIASLRLSRSGALEKGKTRLDVSIAYNGSVQFPFLGPGSRPSRIVSDAASQSPEFFQLYEAAKAA